MTACCCNALCRQLDNHDPFFIGLCMYNSGNRTRCTCTRYVDKCVLLSTIMLIIYYIEYSIYIQKKRVVVVQVKTGGKQKKRMMKVVGLLICLALIMIPVATSTGFFTPTPSPEKQNFKDDDDDGVTGTLQAASDKAQQMKQGAKDVATKAKDKVAEKASGMKHGAKEEEESIIGKGEETVSRTVHKASDKMKQELLVESASKGIMRRAGDVVFRYTMSPSSLTGVMHLLGVAVAYGMCVWVTFASNYVIGRGVLPRQQFVMVQSKIYPLFYKAMASSIGMALLGHLLFRRFPTSLGVQAFNLMASLVMTLVNMLYLEPRTTKVMFERMKKEKEEGVGKDEPIVVGSAAADETTTTTTGGGGGGAAAKKPKSVKPGLNSTYSSMLNVATIISLTWHLVHIAQHLHHNAF
ncbi:hypothetical protein ABFS82_14G320100 [Erythranthe guttata]